MLSIVAPIFHGEEWIKGFLETVTANTVGPFELIFVHDGAVTQVPDFDRPENMKGLKQAVTLQQSGFPRAMNIGTHLVDNDATHVCWSNIDIRFPPGWDDKLVGLLNRHPDIGVIIPMTAGSRTLAHPRKFFGQWPDDVDPRNPGNADACNEACMRLTRAPHFVEQAFVPFFCAVIRRKVLDQIGLLDNQFADMKTTFGLGEDDDWCYRARKAGYKLAVATDCYVWHKWNTFFTTEARSAMIPENIYKRLSDKHGIHPFRHPPVGWQP